MTFNHLLLNQFWQLGDIRRNPPVAALSFLGSELAGGGLPR
jgi:hypothetical protein